VGIYQTDCHWFTAWDGYHTVDVNLSPATVMVTTALHGQSGGGSSYAGIKHYRRRLDSGEDEDVDFGEDWFSWPPAIFDHISSVTFALAEGDDQEGWLIGRLDYWE
jgi:hypothetical protein